MEIIGEKINGTRKRVAQAIAERDEELIRTLARRQADAGATWLDVNAGTHPDQEPADLIWLVETIQAEVDTPLSLDSANPAALAAALPATKKTPLINSISGERSRLDEILPLAASYGCPVIALAMDAKAVPATVEERLAIVTTLLQATRNAGINDASVYVDPLALTVATNVESGLIACDTIRAICERYPDVHITIGLSNISFGLPARAAINRAFLTLAMAAGLDSAILDPLDAELRAAVYATELLLGQDRHCLNYTRAYRAGLLNAAAP
jgi:5-methyltetrahydrofolate--homocysteine methyltransferase